MKTKGILKSHIKQEIVETFLKGLNQNRLYVGLSLVDGAQQTTDFRRTLREYENNVWDTMTVLMSIDKSMGIRPVVPRNNYNVVKGKIKADGIEYVTNEDNSLAIKLYRLKKTGPEESTEKPKHTKGSQVYSDGWEWEILEISNMVDVKKYWTKMHATISYETNIEKGINSLAYIFYSVEYPEGELPVLTNCASLIINPLDNNGKQIEDDFIWYCHKVNFNNQPKLGAFFLKSDPNVTGIISQYDSDNYGYVISGSEFKTTNGFADFSGESIPITSFIKSKVKRMSGYTLFVQKTRKIYCDSRVKLVTFIDEIV